MTTAQIKLFKEHYPNTPALLWNHDTGRYVEVVPEFLTDPDPPRWLLDPGTGKYVLAKIVPGPVNPAYKDACPNCDRPPEDCNGNCVMSPDSWGQMSPTEKDDYVGIVPKKGRSV